MVNTTVELNDFREVARPTQVGANRAELEPVEERAARAAAQLRVADAAIERLPFDLSTLEAGGVFVNVDTQNFGLLDRRLDWQALGIRLPRETDLAFRPPRCGLVPDRYRLPIIRPAAQAHNALHQHSYRFGLIETVFETPSYRWVPWRAWPEFEKRFNATRSSLSAALDEYETDFEAIRAGVLDTFRQLASDSARRLAATDLPVADDFVDTVVLGVAAALPTPQLLRERLSLRFRIGVVQLGSELWAEQRRAAQERRNFDAAVAERRLIEQRELAEQRSIQDELWSNQERQRRQMAAEDEERRREADIKERLRQLKLDAARERLDEALSPLQEGAQQLHARVFDAATSIRDSLQKHQALRGSSARSARNICKWFRLMNWTDDRQLETLIEELEQLATAPVSKGKRNPKPIERVLGDIIALTNADARALTEPNRMAGLEL
jgi:hypothetical protein